MELKDIIEGLINSESDEGCDKELTVVEKKWVNQLKKYAKKINKNEMAKKNQQNDESKRQAIAERLFDNDNLDGLSYIDSDGWCIDGDDCFIKKFYYENENDPNGDSLPATFIVRFKKGLTKVMEKHVNVW